MTKRETTEQTQSERAAIRAMSAKQLGPARACRNWRTSAPS